MAKLLNPLTVQVWKTPRELKFNSTQAVRTWAQSEQEFWSAEPPPHQQLTNYWNTQKSHFAAIASAATHLENELAASPDNTQGAFANFISRTAKPFDLIRRGNIITSDHPRANTIHALSKKEPIAAALLLVSSYANAREIVSSLIGSNALPFETVLTQALSSVDTDEAVRQHQEAIGKLRTQLDEELQNAVDERTAWNEKFKQFNEQEEKLAVERKNAWEEKLKSTGTQWDNALKAYDEKMALAAPTTYWNGRATTSMWSAVAYGGSFAVLVVVAMWAFLHYAIPHLSKVAKPDIPVLTAVLPVLIPAFVGVWVLRIFGRLLSESIQLMQDARERETMVKTFLALMNDEVRGKTLVTDDDRLLILHSLFRPSSVASTDDAPPVHWFDILSRKFGGPTK